MTQFVKPRVMGFMVFNATFNNISVVSWWSILLVGEPEYPGKTTEIRMSEQRERDEPESRMVGASFMHVLDRKVMGTSFSKHVFKI